MYCHAIASAACTILASFLDRCFEDFSLCRLSILRNDFFICINYQVLIKSGCCSLQIAKRSDVPTVVLNLISDSKLSKIIMHQKAFLNRHQSPHTMKISLTPTARVSNVLYAANTWT
jgi:hypothetical protein